MSSGLDVTQGEEQTAEVNKHEFDDSTADDDAYRTCAECGVDCTPAAVVDDSFGARVVFECPTHGVQSLVDPFADQR